MHLAPESTNRRLYPTYGQADFKQIAIAVGVEAEQVVTHAHLFEAAARWHGLDTRRPTHIAPSKLRAKLNRVGNNARRLLTSLGVPASDAAADIPDDHEVVDALVLMGERGADPVVEATRRIGRLVEIIKAVAAAEEFDRRAKQAAAEITTVGKLTVQEGNTGDAALNNWIAEMMSIYRRITGKEPATSVVRPSGRPDGPPRWNEGTASGPLIRFLQAAGKPLDIKYDEDALPSRVRTILKGISRKN